MLPFLQERLGSVPRLVVEAEERSAGRRRIASKQVVFDEPLERLRRLIHTVVNGFFQQAPARDALEVVRHPGVADEAPQNVPGKAWLLWHLVDPGPVSQAACRARGRANGLLLEVYDDRWANPAPLAPGHVTG